MTHDPYKCVPKVPEFHVSSEELVGGAFRVPHFSKIFGIEEGADESPSLKWDGFSPDAKSFMVTCYDPDAPTISGFWHWVVYDIPVSVTSLSSGAGNPDQKNLPEGAKMLKNDAGFAGFLGVAPPPGTTHRYIFCVTALATEKLPIETTSSPPFSQFMALNSGVLGRAFFTISHSRDGNLWC